MNRSEPVSVVVTTYNRSDALIAVLAGLSRQTDRNFEVVVADDGSNDEHRARVVQSAEFRSLQATHVWHPDEGFRAARVRNLGVAHSRGSYLVFLDGDCVPEIDFVAQHRRLAEQGHFVNGSRILLSPRFTAEALADPAQLCGRSRLHWLSRRLAGQASRWWGTWRLPDGAYRVDSGFRWKGIRSCNMAVWKSDFVAVDGFDEIYVGWGHEDADLVLRLHHLGVRRKNGFCATEVFHLWHPESSRSQETANARRVRERSAGALVRAASGYGQVRGVGEVQVTGRG
jgi:glycosyltransferase involved in cell wall biosynthesis